MFTRVKAVANHSILCVCVRACVRAALHKDVGKSQINLMLGIWNVMFYLFQSTLQ